MNTETKIKNLMSLNELITELKLYPETSYVKVFKNNKIQNPGRFYGYCDPLNSYYEDNYSNHIGLGAGVRILLKKEKNKFFQTQSMSAHLKFITTRVIK